MKVLGIWDGHDAGAAIFRSGRLIAAVNEERLSRRKLEIGFPRLSIPTCMEIARLRPDQIDLVACSTSDVAKTLNRALPFLGESYYQIRRRHASPGRLSEIKKKSKYWLTELRPNSLSRRISRTLLVRNLRTVGFRSPELAIVDHHMAHAAGAVLFSAKNPALILTIDGVGDGASATVNTYREGRLTRVATTPARHSLGIFFEHVTNLLNMRELEDEGKVMALADFTFPIADENNPCLDLIRTDGLQFRCITAGHSLQNEIRRIQWRFPNEQLAYMAQRTIEKRMTEFVQAAVRRTGIGNVILAGGTASNIKANRRIRLLPEVESVQIYPHMGDGGLAVGAGALASLERGTTPFLQGDDLGLGPGFSDQTCRSALEAEGLPAVRSPRLVDEVADILTREGVVLWFQGRMEFGPRALGNRSVLARPDRSNIKDRLNLVLKKRVWYQPFCPSMLESAARKLFEDYSEPPCRPMTMAYQVRPESRHQMAGVVSVDGTCRPQIIKDNEEGPFADLLRAVRSRWDIAVLLNTSFNIHGEPLVCRPEEAVSIFLNCDAEALALGPYLVRREDLLS